MFFGESAGTQKLPGKVFPRGNNVMVPVQWMMFPRGNLP